MPLVAEPAVVPEPVLLKLLLELVVVFEAAGILVAAAVVAVEASIEEADAERRGELDRDPASSMGIEYVTAVTSVAMGCRKRQG
jgi:hypothetical protein